MEARIWAVYLNDIVADEFNYQAGDKTDNEFYKFIDQEQERLIAEGYTIKKVEYFSPC